MNNINRFKFSTGITLAILLYLLAKHPDKQELLRKFVFICSFLCNIYGPLSTNDNHLLITVPLNHKNLYIVSKAIYKLSFTFLDYKQSWVNDHLPLATRIWGPILCFYTATITTYHYFIFIIITYFIDNFFWVSKDGRCTHLQLKLVGFLS